MDPLRAYLCIPGGVLVTYGGAFILRIRQQIARGVSDLFKVTQSVGRRVGNVSFGTGQRMGSPVKETPS